jgi:hypothetical protein
MPLTPEERVECRHHLGFLQVGYASTFALGVPQATEVAFAIEGAMNNVLEVALPKVRDILCILRKIEGQKVGDLELLAVESLGEIALRADEQRLLDREYRRWQGALANALGVYQNPFDKRPGSGANVSVS